MCMWMGELGKFPWHEVEKNVVVTHALIYIFRLL